MAIIYVDSNAVGLNDGTSWANAFSTVTEAITQANTNAVFGQVIWVASDHLRSETTVSIDYISSYGLIIISVNKTTDTYEIGAKESIYQAATNSYFNIIGGSGARLTFIGMLLSPYTSFQGDGHNNIVKFIDCTLSFTGNNVAHNFFSTNYDSSNITYDNCVLDSSIGGSGFIYEKNGGRATLLNGTKLIGKFNFTGGGGGGGDFEITDVDMTQVTTLTTPLFTLGNSFDDDNIRISISRTVLPLGVLANGIIETIASPQILLDAVACTEPDGGNNAYWYSQTNRYEGETHTTKLVYLHYKYDDISGASTKLESTNASMTSPLRHKLCEIPAQDLAAADKTFRVNLLLDTGTAASLTDTEFWVELSHNDNVSLVLGKIVSSRNTDIIAAGVTLTTSAETWLGTLPATSQAYQVDIQLSSAGLPNVTNGSVVIYANLAVPNVDVYVDPAVQIGT